MSLEIRVCTCSDVMLWLGDDNLKWDDRFIPKAQYESNVRGWKIDLSDQLNQSRLIKEGNILL